MPFVTTANTNDCAFTVIWHVGGADQPVLLMGWIYPTALATGAHISSSNDADGCRVTTGNSNSALLQVTNGRTTPDVFTGSTSIFANTQWTFYAVLYNAETGTDTVNVAAWVGIGLDPPIEETMTQTTPGVGNIGAGATAWYIGGPTTTSTNTLIGAYGPQACYQFPGNGSSSQTHPINVITAGAITADTKSICFDRYVRPFWEGKLHTEAQVGRTFQGTASMEVYDCFQGFTPQGGGGYMHRVQPYTNSGNISPVTASACSATTVRQPRAYPQWHTPYLLPLRRR